MATLLTIGQVAEASGLSPDTIRYYEREGVLPRVPRGSNSYRGYPAEHVETLRFARRLRELGLAPAVMADLIRLFHDGTCQQMRDALVESCGKTLDTVRARRLELERVESQLGAVLAGLERQAVDDHRISTVTPCACVALVEQEPSL
jgi:DNA-binding transcriptional MerR regulator